MIHEVLPVGLLACNCSVIGDEATREAIVIDPGDDVSAIVEILNRHRLKVKTIVFSLAHIDHIGGAHKLRALTGAPVYMHEADTVLADNLEMQASWRSGAPKHASAANTFRELSVEWPTQRSRSLVKRGSAYRITA